MNDRPVRRSALLVLLLVLAGSITYFRTPDDKRVGEHPPPAVDSSSGSPVVPSGPPPAAVAQAAPDTLPARRTVRGALPVFPPLKPFPPDSLRADLAVNEFMRDFYEDVNQRTVTSPIPVLIRRVRSGGHLPGR